MQEEIKPICDYCKKPLDKIFLHIKGEKQFVLCRECKGKEIKINLSL